MDEDEDEDVLMLSDEENQLTSIKTVSIHMFGSLESKWKTDTMYRVVKSATNVKLSLTTQMTTTRKLSLLIPDELPTSEALRLPMQSEVYCLLTLHTGTSN